MQMEWSAVLFGVIIPLFLIFLVKPKQQSYPVRTRPTDGTATPPRFTYAPDRNPLLDPTRLPPGRVPAQQPLSSLVTDESVSTRVLIETWKRSIVSLIKLAQSNLTWADHCLETGDCKAAFEIALTSTENISRALLHCYGEKPVQSSGQEDALKLLARRFAGTMKTDLEGAAEEITRLHSNEVVKRYLSTRNLDLSLLLTRAKTALILESASRVVTLFSQIIDENFATEIPELREARCPKCHAMDLSVFSFDETSVSYACRRCKHSWTEPRTSA